MVKFVASVTAGVIAAVLGSLILNYITNHQGHQGAPQVTTPSATNRPGAADLPPGFVLDEPVATGPTDAQLNGYLSRSEAEQNCDKRALILKVEHGPRAGAIFATEISNRDTTDPGAI